MLNDRPLNTEPPARLLDDDITPAKHKFVRNNGIPPEIKAIDPATWSLEVGGESCKNPQNFTIAEIQERFKHHTHPLHQHSLSWLHRRAVPVQAERAGRVRRLWGLRLISWLVLIGASTSAFSEHVFVYRWIDPVDGDVHYAATAPDGAAYDMVAIQRAPPVDTQRQRELQIIDEQVNERIDARKQQRAKQRYDAAARVARQKSCTRLRDWLQKLESRPGPRLLLVDSDGNARRMTEDERQAKLADAQQRIKAECDATK